jgi:hypothetical protein
MGEPRPLDHFTELLRWHFPDGAELYPTETLTGGQININWKLGEPARQHKRSKLIKLVISSKDLEDYFDESEGQRHDIEEQLVAFVHKKLSTFVATHEALPIGLPQPSEVWNFVRRAR